jgi:hypothetical protein
MFQRQVQAGVDERTVELILARVTAALREDIEALLTTFTRRETSNRSLTVEQLAARLGVARSTVYADCQEGGGYNLGTDPKAPIRFSADRLSATRHGAAPSPAQAPPSSNMSRRRRDRRLLIKDAPRVTHRRELLDRYK